MLRIGISCYRMNKHLSPSLIVLLTRTLETSSLQDLDFLHLFSGCDSVGASFRNEPWIAFKPRKIDLTQIREMGAYIRHK